MSAEKENKFINNQVHSLLFLYIEKKKQEKHVLYEKSNE